MDSYLFFAKIFRNYLLCYKILASLFNLMIISNYLN